MSIQGNWDRRRLLSRREFVGIGGMSAAALLLGTGALTNNRALAQTSFLDNPFKLGVASGDPRPNGVVLWTRLAPNPLAEDGSGGMPPESFGVRYEVAEDENFGRIVRRGTAAATPELGHSVHPEVRGLGSGREYFYRFKVGPEVSPVGRTRTAPDLGAPVGNFRFAFASCQNYQDGYYHALRSMAEENVDLVAFLGDYIYESVPRTNTPRTHEGTGEPISLANYRNRHAQYKTDPDLQAAHARCPWVVTFDDHELDNNWADDIPQDPRNQSPEAFRARRIAAFQAYYEHMPLREVSFPSGPDMRLYRRLAFGDLLEINVLDTRQYRSDQPATLQGAYDPNATMTGDEQERWLYAGLEASSARWNLVAQQVMVAQNDRRAGPVEEYDLDNWDGYRAPRQRLLDFFGSGRTSNPIVLTGDRHATWVCDLKKDFYDEASPTVGAEFTGTSITSGGNGDNASFHARYDPIKAESPHWKYVDGLRGYMVCDVERERMLTSLRTVPVVTTPNASATYTSARFVVENGRPGVEVV